MDALRDLMAREMGTLEPRPVTAQSAAIATRPAAKAESRPNPARTDARDQPARREVKIDPIARATLDKLMAGEIARVEHASPAPTRAAAPVPDAPGPAAARPVTAPFARTALLPPAAPTPAPVRTVPTPQTSQLVRPAPVSPRSPAPAAVSPRSSAAQPAPTSRGQWSKLAWPTAAPIPRPAPTAVPATTQAAPSAPEPQPALAVQTPTAEAQAATEPAPADDVKPSVPRVLAALFEARAVPGGKGVFAVKPIAKGTPLFGDDDWADEEERKSFSALSLQQFEELKPTLRTVFLRYAYNTSLDQITGAFRPELVRDPVNFINHSCDPNAGYDGAGNIVALRGIAADEEIRMDYGTFSFSFDHEFTCGCQALWCRGKVTAKDWPDLVRAGLRLPAFMRQETAKALWG